MNYLISIPGRFFLLIFLCYGIIVIIIASILKKRDESYGLEIPEPTSLKPFELAIITGGIKNAIRLSLFNLFKTKIIDFKQEKKGITVTRVVNDKLSKDNPIESYILKKLDQSQFYISFFSSFSINEIESQLTNSFNKLKTMQLFPSSSIKKRIYKIFLFTLLFILVPGVLKLYFGIVRDKPFGFLIILLFVFIFAAIIAIKPFRIYTTSLGKKLIKASKIRFEYMKTKKNQQVENYEMIMYGAAIFGLSSFAMSSETSLFKIPESKDNSTTGGCSSGCSSDGGDGGGDGGGGGCGGCGGGD